MIIELIQGTWSMLSFADKVFIICWSILAVAILIRAYIKTRQTPEAQKK